MTVARAVPAVMMMAIWVPRIDVIVNREQPIFDIVTSSARRKRIERTMTSAIVSRVTSETMPMITIM